MSYTTPEVKLRTLAAANVTLQGFLGTTPFRWFDIQLAPKYIEVGTCVRIRRVSTIVEYFQAGIVDLTCPRFQIDVLDYSADVSRQVAKAIVDFLSTFNLYEQYVSTPKNTANFLLNQRHGMEPNTRTPVFVTSLDVRLYNSESLA